MPPILGMSLELHELLERNFNHFPFSNDGLNLCLFLSLSRSFWLAFLCEVLKLTLLFFFSSFYYPRFIIRHKHSIECMRVWKKLIESMNFINKSTLHQTQIYDRKESE